MEEALDRLPGSHGRRQGDHGHHEDAGQVLGAPVAIGVTLGRPPPPQDEGDAQRHGRQRIGEVVDGVTQQSHRSADEDDDELEGRSCSQRGEGDLELTYPLGAGGQGGVDRVGGVMTVRREHPGNEAPDAARPVVVPACAVAMVVSDGIGLVVVGV